MSLRVMIFLVPGLLLLFSVKAIAAGTVVKIWEDYTIPAGQKVENVIVMGGTLRVDGEVTGDILAFGGSTVINGNVGGDLAKFGGYLRIGEHAGVAGDFSQIGGEFTREPGSVIRGDSSYLSVREIPGPVLVIVLFAIVAGGIVCGLLGYVLVRARRINVMAERIHTNFGGVLLTGVGAALVTGFLMFLVLRINVNRAVFAFLLLTDLVIAFVGYAGVSAWVGSKVSHKAGQFATITIGATVISVLQAIPVVGICAFLFFLFVALGGALVTWFGSVSSGLPQTAPQHKLVDT